MTQTSIDDYLEQLKTIFNNNNYLTRITSRIESEKIITLEYLSRPGFYEPQNQRPGYLICNFYNISRKTKGIEDFLKELKRIYAETNSVQILTELEDPRYRTFNHIFFSTEDFPIKHNR